MRLMDTGCCLDKAADGWDVGGCAVRELVTSFVDGAV